jgi:MiaB/RimO family radical SAM methylthiotransferase
VHRDNPAARIVVAGCYAQRDAATAAGLPGVCLVVGNAEKTRIPDLLEAAEEFQDKKIFRPDNLITINNAELNEPVKILYSERAQVSKKEASENFKVQGGGDAAYSAVRKAAPTPQFGILAAGLYKFGKSVPVRSISPRTGDRTRPLVKLQDGCDNRCAYCIVPSVRGPARSVPPEDVLWEIRSLTDLGFREIVLTGINLGAYGLRIKGHARLIDLLRQIVVLPGVGRIRLSSVEPVFLDREIVRLAGENPVLARHFHIPLQSGSDRILRLMRRPYTASLFREIMEFIHMELPDAGLGTDVITGFPGETDKDFEETRRFIEETPFSYLHVFPFSPREGTEAFSLPGRVPSHVVKTRTAEIINLGRAKNLEFRRGFLGRTLSAITLSKEEAEGDSVVLTHNFIHARVPGLSVPPNRFVEVRIEEIREGSTYAAVVSHE